MSKPLGEKGGNDYEIVPSVELRAALLDTRPPFDVNWDQSAFALEEEARLLRLARVKALLPPSNAIDEKTTHDVTLENYIRLALQAAGDRQTLDTFLGCVQHTLDTSPEESALLAQQVFWIWAPAAEIAGLYHHKIELEDTAFQILMPDEFNKLQKEYDRVTLEEADGPLEHIKEQIELLLELRLEDVTSEVQARPKAMYSAWEKTRRKGRALHELFDLVGFRIIVDGDDEEIAVNNCYRAMAAVTSEFEPNPSRHKDYIESPKASGYQSLHLTLCTPAGLTFELQIRTRNMHIAAETDTTMSHQTVAATFRQVPGKVLKSARKVSRLYKWRDSATAFIRATDGLCEGILGRDILFFREDGNLYLTSEGSNMLDASFRIHSQRAFRTKAVYRNGALVNFEETLHHGDVVTVECWSRSLFPTDPARYDELQTHVITKYASQAIERAKRQLPAVREQYRQVAKRRIAELAKVDISDPLSTLTEKDRQGLAKAAGAPTFDKLLEIIGHGDKSGKPGRVAQLIRTKLGLKPIASTKEIPKPHVFMSDEDVLAAILIPVEGSGGLSCSVGQCCSGKIRGEEAVLIRPSHLDGMLRLHRVACANVRSLHGTLPCTWKS